MTDIKELQLKEMEMSINNVFDSLTNNPINASIQETLFKGYFLPFFAGQNDADLSALKYRQWLDIAGTPLSEVSVLDNQHQLLFIVPSMVNTAIIKVKRGRDSAPVAAIYEEGLSRIRNHPIQGENFILDAIEKRANQFINEEESEEEKIFLKRWHDIFFRYGLVTSNSNLVNQDQLTEDLIYD